MCLPGLDKTGDTVLEHLTERDILYLFRHCVTVTIDLLTPKIDWFVDHVCHFASKSVYSL